MKRDDRTTLMTWALLSAAVLALAAPASAPAQSGPPVKGYPVTVRGHSPAFRATGELFAVTPDSVWLLERTQLTAVPLADIDRVSIRRHGFGAGSALLWAGAGGLASGGLLTAACSSVSDDCGGVFIGTMISWLVVGGLAALTVEPSRHVRFDAPEYRQLRAYARFPQGPPDRDPGPITRKR